jgi:Ca-activated chloride channel family protein
MRSRLILVVVLSLAAASFIMTGAMADTVSLSQLDSSGLLVSQKVDAYVSVTDEQGKAVEGLPSQAFKVAESSDGRTFRPIESLLAFQPRAGAANGIAFLLLLDNSGSMYDALDGTPTKDPAAMRVTHAKEAVRAFLASMTNPQDRVGLVSFNTSFTVLSPPIGQRELIGNLLDRIQRPTTEQAYTELYASLSLASQQFAGIRGRKAIIVLSDGENYPYAQYSGKEHPVFKQKLFLPTESILSNQEEGVSVYGISFGTGSQPDQNLRQITRETGGQMFSAVNRDELAGVYEQIHRQVASEYLLSYRATVDPAERKYVRVSVAAPGGETSATRFYFAGTVFGLPLPWLSVLLVLPFLLAGALLWLLTALKLERGPGPARLEVLYTRVGHPMTRVVSLGGAKTVIGASPKADLTIAGSPQMKEQHATIVKDPASSSYTITDGGGDVMVNNQPVKTRKLEPGDVIDVGGSTIVFEGEERNGESKGERRDRKRRHRK